MSTLADFLTLENDERLRIKDTADSMSEGLAALRADKTAPEVEAMLDELNRPWAMSFDYSTWEVTVRVQFWLYAVSLSWPAAQDEGYVVRVDYGQQPRRRAVMSVKCVVGTKAALEEFRSTIDRHAALK